MLSQGVLDVATAHMYSDTDVEMGGFFVGTIEEGLAHVAAAIPALRATGSRVHLQFGHDTWSDVAEIVDREHDGMSIVGWFHSHPGHGIFLSGYDEFIQQNFFSVDGMVALVVDPTDGALGWFETNDSRILEPLRQNVAAAPIADAGRAPSPRPDRSPSRQRIIAVGALALAAGAVGGFAAAGVSDDPGATLRALRASRSEVETLRRSQDRLEADLLAQSGQDVGSKGATNAPPAPSTTAPSTQAPAMPTPSTTPSEQMYTIAAGDSLWSIAEAQLGDGARWTEIYALNRPVIGDLGDDATLPGSTLDKTIVLPQ